MQTDFVSSNHGSIVTLTPCTDAAKDWLLNNCLPSEDGVEAEGGDDLLWPLAIDHRMFLDIATGLLEDGLTMQDAATGRMASLP